MSATEYLVVSHGYAEDLDEFLTEFINRTLILGEEIASLYLI